MKEARVIQEHKTNYIISDNGKEFVGTVRGSFFAKDVLFPKVGDMVVYEELSDGKAAIEEVLPRQSTISRMAVGSETEQVIVTNVDLICIVMGLDGDFNPSRLERYMLLAAQSKIRPVVILNKADQVTNIEDYLKRIKDIVGDTPVHAVSALTGVGMDVLSKYLTNGAITVLLGSSGAGKSTITNWLLNEDRQSVAAVRLDDSRGMHTTTSKQMFLLSTGGYLIDTPGMRELGMVESTEEDEYEVFDKIEELSLQCKYTNCDHEKSGGCAVLAECEKDPEFARQVKNFQKLQVERLAKKEKEKEVTKQLNKFYKKDPRKKFNG